MLRSHTNNGEYVWSLSTKWNNTTGPSSIFKEQTKSYFIWRGSSYAARKSLKPQIEGRTTQWPNENDEKTKHHTGNRDWSKRIPLTNMSTLMGICSSCSTGSIVLLAHFVLFLLKIHFYFIKHILLLNMITIGLDTNYTNLQGSSPHNK